MPVPVPVPVPNGFVAVVPPKLPNPPNPPAVAVGVVVAPPIGFVVFGLLPQFPNILLGAVVVVDVVAVVAPPNDPSGFAAVVVGLALFKKLGVGVLDLF